MKTLFATLALVLVASAASAYPLSTYPKGTTVAQYRAAEAQTARVNGDRNPRVTDPSFYVRLQVAANQTNW
jgi:hypothetical protein